jgi:hypothetical protein
MKTKTRTAYDTDYQRWLEETIAQLHQGEFSSIDWPNLLEELTDLGKNNQRAIESLLTRLIEHLLKFAYWESAWEYNQRGWKGEIRNFRKQIKKTLKQSPSLFGYLESVFEECYCDAREIVIDITGLDPVIFPVRAIASLDEILDENWFPPLASEPGQ